MKKKNAAAGAFSAAAASAAAFWAAGRYFFNFVFERDPIKKLVPFGEGNEYGKIIDRGREWLFANETEQVFLRSEDGLLLKAHYFAAEHSERTMLLCHGWRGSWHQDFGPTARWLYEQGWNLLAIEERGQGESEGNYITFGIREKRDIVCWAKWLNENRHPDRIWLCGLSMGASAVLAAGGEEDLSENVRGIIADCGFTEPMEMFRKAGKEMIGNLTGPMSRLLCTMAKRRIHVDPEHFSTLDAVKNIRIPVLFIHGREDSFVPCEMSVRNYEACSSPKKHLYLAEGADHCMSWFVDRERYEKEVTDFFRECGE